MAIYHVADSYYYVVLILGGTGVVRWIVSAITARRMGDQADDRYWVCATALAGGILTYLPFFGTARFHFALLPLVVIFAAQLLSDQLARVRQPSMAQV